MVGTTKPTGRTLLVPPHLVPSHRTHVHGDHLSHKISLYEEKEKEADKISTHHTTHDSIDIKKNTTHDSVWSNKPYTHKLQIWSWTK